MGRLAATVLIDTIATPSYDGAGTIAVAPGSGYALACGNNILNVIQAPFNAGSTITTLTLTGSIATYQTQAVVFNGAGRAFVYHTQGISVVEPPYNAIAFTMPLPYDNSSSGAIAISPDGNTLLTTDFTSTVYIFKAPFSPSSTPEALTINTGLIALDSTDTGSNNAGGPDNNSIAQSQAGGFDPVNITPDGAKALLGTFPIGKVYVISAPFSSSALVEEIPLPAAFSSGANFEDIGLSPDGKLAIITGGSSNESAPAAFIQAPFTAAGATVFAVNILGGGRGAGAVRFQPAGT